MTVILQVSDPHFGTEQRPVVEALVELSHRLAPDLLILSGDITQRARTAQFSAAAAFVRRLQVPHVLAVPGNHDLPLFDLATRVLDPYAGFKRIFGAELEPTWRSADCLVLGVKTTRRYRHVDGEISHEQRARVSGELLKAAPAQLRVIVLHQPIAVPRHSEDKNLVHGHAEAVQAWSRAGADIILAGHIHLPFVLALHDGAALPRPIWAVNAGTAVSHRVRQDAGNSVNVLRTAQPPAAGRCTVEHWSYSGVGSGFVCSAQLPLC
ncbi:MAG TPA: metallophosphoesterase [Polyangiaceae bacterium]